MLTGNPPELTLEDFIRDCARFGLEGTELTSYYFPKKPTQEYLCQLKRLTFLLGLDITGTAGGQRFLLSARAGARRADRQREEMDRLRRDPRPRR